MVVYLPGGSNSETFDDPDRNTSGSGRKNNATRSAAKRLGASLSHQLTLRARAVMAALLVFAGEADTCSPSVAELASEARVCERTVQRALRDLESTGWIATTIRPIAPAMNDTSLYRLLPAGWFLDRERALRARPSSGATGETPSSSISPAAQPGSDENEGARSTGGAPQVEGLRPEDLEAERVLDQIGPAPQAPIPDPKIPMVLEPRVDLDPTSVSSSTSARGAAKAGGGAAERGAIAPSGTARAGATPTRLVGVFLERQGMADLTGDGFELRLLGLARRGGAPLSVLLGAIQAVGERRAERLLAPDRPTSPWAGPAREARAYTYVSIRNELEVAAGPAAITPCLPRRRFHLVESMQEASLDEPGKKVLALIRELEPLQRLANPEVAHRLSRFSQDNGTGKLTTEDVLHTIRRASENEADRRAAEGARAQAQLMAFVVALLGGAARGCANGGGGGGSGPRAGAVPARGFEVQDGGVVGDTHDW